LASLIFFDVAIRMGCCFFFSPSVKTWRASLPRAGRNHPFCSPPPLRTLRVLFRSFPKTISPRFFQVYLARLSNSFGPFLVSFCVVTKVTLLLAIPPHRFVVFWLLSLLPTAVWLLPTFFYPTCSPFFPPGFPISPLSFSTPFYILRIPWGRVSSCPHMSGATFSQASAQAPHREGPRWSFFPPTPPFL